MTLVTQSGPGTMKMFDTSATLMGIVTCPMPSLATTQCAAVRKIPLAPESAMVVPVQALERVELTWSMSAMTASCVLSGMPPTIGS